MLYSGSGASADNKASLPAGIETATPPRTGVNADPSIVDRQCWDHTNTAASARLEHHTLQFGRSDFESYALLHHETMSDLMKALSRIDINNELVGQAIVTETYVLPSAKIIKR